MITHDGVKVEVRIDDVAIPEYMVEKELAQKRVTCWIPSQTGKEFAILVINERQGKLSVGVKADGINVHTPVLRPQEEENVAFYQESLTEQRPFVFAKLELVDDDNLLDVSGCLKVGEIELLCSDFIGVKTCPPKIKDTTKFVENKKVHERTKKGVEVHIGLGRVLGVSDKVTYVKPQHKEHVVTFVFRYRPPDYLQAQGIVYLDAPQQLTSSVVNTTLQEGSSSQGGPVPDGQKLEAKIGDKVKEEFEMLEVDVDDDEEIKTLLNIVEKMRAQKRKQKMAEAPRKKVKKEDSTPAFAPGQMIDLT